ncbi:alpha/beta hydrolase [Mycobacterium sp. M1]|uniref:Alpha/beta hydrolase n=1 Tax=Mycolicibacter acidiphilus TaxID=2835306 RepID=A0ABS5RJF7_9MYCO|nr:alpha/beta hydrolase [Mycolicibacter acidiphilus]MBS9534430.1 alpha/beta hydrolase [Mycolicibacter acidiphilus]
MRIRRDTGLLLVGVLGAAAAANAVRPVRRTGPLSILAFVLGMPVSEMPWHTVLGPSLVAAVAARGGGLRTGRGRLATALTAVSAVALLRVHRTAAAAGQVLELALIDGLGGGYRHGIADPADPVLQRRPGRLAVPNPVVRQRYRVARDVRYGPDRRYHTLDVWHRPDLDHDARAPVLVQIHGGAWVSGRKEGQGEPLMAHLADRGWVCVTVNYRLSPRADWPDHIIDVKRALAWVKAHIAEYGGDPGFVAVTGGSAGGQLAALAALTPGRAEWQPGFESADTSVAAAVTFYGVYDFLNRYGGGRDDMERWLQKRLFKSPADRDRTRWDQASPIGRVTPDAPPFFVLHGVNDSLFHVEQAREFVRDLTAVSANPVVYAELPGAQHAFDTLPSLRVYHTVRAVERFLAVVRGRSAAS